MALWRRADVLRVIGAETVKETRKAHTMNLLEIRTWADARAFLHVALPGVAGILAVAGYVSSEDAGLWLAAIFVVLDAGLSTFYTANGFRKFLYPALSITGLLLVRYGVTTSETWALWTGLVPILFGGGVAAANTPTTPASPFGVSGQPRG